MAIRQLRYIGDRILTMKARKVDVFDEKINMIVDDMFETMYAADGCGLAAPQVGILRRIVVIDVEGDKHVLINPEIVKTSGSVTLAESCLSVPEQYGEVTRPQKVTVRAFDQSGKPFELTGEDMLARAICHECDHLDGVLFTTKVNGKLKDKQ